MTRNTKIALASLAAVLFIAGAFTAGRLLQGKTPPQKTQELELQATLPPVQPVNASEVVLGVDAEVESVTYYALCGHKEIKRLPAGKELIGKSRSDIEALYPDWTITDFTSDCVTIEHSVALRCPKHYILKSKDQGLSVYRTDAAKLEESEVASFEMDVGNLPEDIQQMLSDGMVFETLGEIEAYLEDLDS